MLTTLLFLLKQKDGNPLPNETPFSEAGTAGSWAAFFVGTEKDFHQADVVLGQAYVNDI